MCFTVALLISANLPQLSILETAQAQALGLLLDTPCSLTLHIRSCRNICWLLLLHFTPPTLHPSPGLLPFFPLLGNKLSILLLNLLNLLIGSIYWCQLHSGADPQRLKQRR